MSHDDSQQYSVSQALMLQLDAAGSWLGTNSVSRDPQLLSDDALPVLAAFAGPATPNEVFASLSEEWEVDREEFDSIMKRLIDLGFLTTTSDQAKPSLARDGFAQALPHFFMIRDAIRVAAYQGAIERHCIDKSVLEIGCGSGILSVFAARAQARSVIAIEESEIASVAQRMFEANDCDDVVDLRLGNSRDVHIDEPVDVIVHEILGTDPLAENLLLYLRDARQRFLKPGGRLIPYRLEIACVGIEIDQPAMLDRDQVLKEAQQFSTAYGINFDPLVEELEKTPAARYPRHLDFPRGEPFTAPILTREARLWDLDLRQELEEDFAGQPLTLEVDRAGRMGGLLVFFHAHLDEQSVLSTSPFAPPTHWGWDVRMLSKEVQVEPGDTVDLQMGSYFHRGTQRVSIDWA